MLESPYQNEPSEIRVLVPDNYDPKKKYPVVYILPVGAAKGLDKALRSLSLPWPICRIATT